MRCGWVALLLLTCVSVSHGGTFVAFGPTNVRRTTGQPNTMTASFTILNPKTTYTLRINNGGLQGEFARVASASVTLNGVQVVRPREFNLSVAVIEKPIKLVLTNKVTVSVDLSSVPGSGVTVQVIGLDNDLPTLTATVTPHRTRQAGTGHL